MRPDSVGETSAFTSNCDTASTASEAIVVESSPPLMPRSSSQRSYGSSRSVATAIEAIIAIASTGYLPIAVSWDSITASVPSKIALATSVTSARVGRVEWTIDSSIWVAVIVGLA